jgi:L-threonylcarbamoyladenylate synthase
VQEFGAGLTVLDGGACPIGIESTIVDCTRDAPALLRPGRITPQAIEAALGGTPLRPPDASAPRASGTLAAHYAPNARVRLFDDPAALAAAWQALAPPSRSGVAVYSRLAPEPGGMRAFRRRPAAADEVAHELFAVLRAFDDAGAGQIWVERPPAGADWEAVNDRLRRAAAS